MADADQVHGTPDVQSQEPATYIEKPTIRNGMTGIAVGAGSGVFIAAIQNALTKHEGGAMGMFTRHGSTISLLASTAGIFGFSEAAVSNIRGKEDALNGAAGGCAAGLVIGASVRSIPTMVGSCAGLATLIGTFDAAGGSLMGDFATSNPISEGLASLGGHGNEAAGTSGWREAREERRRRFFKQPQQSETKTE
ncbi:unnamed protein product [Sympodiomycopsis kandeliae]